MPQIGQTGLPESTALGEPVIAVAGRATVAATIADTASLSGAVDLGGYSLVGLVTPAGWATAVITFQVSVDNATWLEYEDVNGTAVTIPSTAASKYRAIDASDFVGIRYLKVRSGTAGTPVAQSGGDVVTIVVRGI